METNKIPHRMAGLSLAIGLANAAWAVEVGGLKFDDSSLKPQLLGATS